MKLNPPRQSKSTAQSPNGANSKRPNRDGFFDTQTGVLFGIPKSAMCVQRFDDSLNSAIHITYRISLRSSSLREPRDPLSKVVLFFSYDRSHIKLRRRKTKNKKTRSFSDAVPSQAPKNPKALGAYSLSAGNPSVRRVVKTVADPEGRNHLRSGRFTTQSLAVCHRCRGDLASGSPQ